MTCTTHPIPPGLWCGPAALVAITGDDFDSVIHPALNRHMRGKMLTQMVVGSTLPAMYAVLGERGYKVRAYKNDDIRAHVTTWAQRSRDRYPGRMLLIGVPEHVMVICDGIVYDTWTPHGAQGATHPYAKTTVTSVVLVER